MILYGTLIIVGAMELGSGLGAISVGLLGETRNRETLYIMGIVANLIQIPIIFSVGRWVGRRCASHGIVAIFLISFFARLATTLGDVWLMGSARMTQFLGIHIMPVTISLLVAGGAILFALISLIGYWRGKQQRLAAYLTYLLQSVSEDTRRAIVDLAFEEACATVTRRPSLA